MRVELRQLICDRCGAESRVYQASKNYYGKEDVPAGWDSSVEFGSGIYRQYFSHACPRCLAEKRLTHAPTT